MYYSAFLTCGVFVNLKSLVTVLNIRMHQIMLLWHKMISVMTSSQWLCQTLCNHTFCSNTDRLVQERHNSIANALELRLSYTDPSMQSNDFSCQPGVSNIVHMRWGQAIAPEGVMRDVFMYPSPSFNCGLAKPPRNFGYGCVIASHTLFECYCLSMSWSWCWLKLSQVKSNQVYFS